MNNSTTKKRLKVAIIVLALLLTIALGVGTSAAWYTAKRQATGTILLKSGIAIQYKGFGEEASTTWTKENDTLANKLLTVSEVIPGSKVLVTPNSDVRLTNKSVDAYLRVKISYKFYAATDSATPYTDAELSAAKSTFTASELITMGNSNQESTAFFGENFTKSGDYYYYTTAADGDTLQKVGHATDDEDTTTGFVNLFAEGAQFVIEGPKFVGADNGEGKGYVVKAAVMSEDGKTVVQPAVVISKIEVVLELDFIQANDKAVTSWDISKVAA